jgi:thioredoxin reductase (NADPH)
MITAAELRKVPLFEGVGEDELAHLAARAADIRLIAGQYAIREGDPRALLVVLEGEADVTRRIDGVERIIGHRNPGEAVGEFPMVLGMPWPASVRAIGELRIMRIEPREYYTLLAAAPAVADRITESARDRIEGLTEINADPTPVQVTIVGHAWDAASHVLRTFLDRNRVPYETVSPDDPEIESLVPGLATLSGRYPAAAIRGGALLAEPATRELARGLGLTTVPERATYDVIIVGGGPAGLGAAVYGSSEGLGTLLVEREAPGGQAGTSSRIENYLGFPSGISGDELAGRALQQAQRLGAEILVTRSVVAIDPKTREVELDGGELVCAQAIILAMGVAWRRLDIPDFERLTGRGIFYGAARSEASAVSGEDIYLIGAGNSAGQAAMHFANHARYVTIIYRGESLSKSMSYYLIEQLRTKANVHVRTRSEVSAVYGDDHLAAIDIVNRESGETERCEATGLFVFIGADAATDWLPPEIARDPLGYILTGNDVIAAGAWPESREPFLLETNVPGVFACGDVRYRSVKRVASGVGEGSMTVAFVHQYLATLEGAKPHGGV